MIEIPDGLELTVGFLLGLFVGGIAMAPIVGAIAMSGRADAVRRAYLAGMRAAQSDRFTVPPVSWEDLECDEATELGRWPDDYPNREWRA